MKAVRDKILEECNISRILRQSAWDADYGEAVKIREKQQFHWEKFNFMKELNKAMEKKGI